MGLLDDIKKGMGLDAGSKAERAQKEATDAAAEAAKKADEAKKAQEEAARENGTAAQPTPAPAPTPTPAPAPQAAARTYTVKSGDTLSAIGERYGVSWQKIAEVNKIANPDLIYPGQVFTIPE